MSMESIAGESSTNGNLPPQKDDDYRKRILQSAHLGAYCCVQLPIDRLDID